MLILSEIVLGLASVSALSKSRKLFPQVPHPRISTAVALGSLAMLALTFLGYIGLWRMWRSARGVFTTAWLLSLIFLAVGGPYVLTSAAEVLVDLTVAINGAILALIWFSELRGEFGGPVADRGMP